MFVPHIFLSRGEEKMLSQTLRKTALERVLHIPFSVYVDERGKPFVDADFPVGISITHSGGVVAVGVFPFEKVGIDMEKIEKDFPHRVADRFFTHSEKASIQNEQDYYKIWCKKESYVKLTGDGISSLAEFDSTAAEYKFCDLSEKVSEQLCEKFVFFTCCEKEPEEIKLVLI